MKKWTLTALAAVLLLIAAGCGAGSERPYQDEAAIKVNITSEPAAAANQPLVMTAAIEGLVTEEDMRIDFDIREETEQELPILKTAEKIAPGQYQIQHTFPTAGKYVIYIHIYSGDDLHIIKRSIFEVA